MFTQGPFDTSKKFHIPGYRGYVPKMRPENLYGKTYSSITRQILNSDEPKQSIGGFYISFNYAFIFIFWHKYKEMSK